MSRARPVIKREFTEMVTSRGFLIGTVLGPLMMIGLFAVQYFIAVKGSGGEHRIAILDTTGAGIGDRVQQELEHPLPGTGIGSRATFTVTVERVPAAEREAATARLQEQVRTNQLDGFLLVPPGMLTGDTARYEGKDAANSTALGQVEGALQRAVQSERLREQGIDQAALLAALTPVKLQAFKTGEGGVQGNPTAARILAFLMSFAIYMAVLLYGQGIMNGVQEEKRDRIVELVVSSIRARDLLLGKVVGIGAAGVVQMLVWAATAAVLLTYGGTILSLVGADPSLITAIQTARALPKVPLSAGIIFILCFAGGFFLFATLYAVVGAAITNPQEAQGLITPIIVPFIFGLFIAMSAGENPSSGLAVAGTFIPLTSPVILPVRALSGEIAWWEEVASLAVLFATAFFMIWVAAKIYRIAIFATGKKPSWAELIRWARAA